MGVAEKAIIFGPLTAHLPAQGDAGGWRLGGAQPNSAVPAAEPCADAVLRDPQAQMGTPTVLPADLRQRSAGVSRP